MVGRDENGRFVKGHAPSNNGKGGRPKRSTEEKYLAALSRRVKMEDWNKIIDTAVSRAKAGDSVARKWLSDYLLGPPTQRVDLDVQGQSYLQIEYVNDWRDTASLPAQGPEDS